MSQYENIDAGYTGKRGFTMIDSATVEPIVSGNIFWHLKALSGTNANKWYTVDDGVWNASWPGNANGMSEEVSGDGAYVIDPTNGGAYPSPFALGVQYFEHATEIGNSHIPVQRWLNAKTPVEQLEIELTDEAIAAIAQASAQATAVLIGGGGSTGADLETQPVPVSRTLVLVESADGMRSEDPQIITAGQPLQTYAADFRNDLSANQNVWTIDAIEFVQGSSSGMLISTIESWKRNGYTQARFQAAGITPSDVEYVARVSVTYGNPSGAGVGDLRFKIVP